MFTAVITSWFLVQAILVPHPNTGWQFEYHTVMGPYTTEAACNVTRDLFLTFAAANPYATQQSYVLACIPVS